MLLGGHPPFSDDHDERLFRLIKRGEFSFHAAAWAGISAPAKVWTRLRVASRADAVLLRVRAGNPVRDNA